MAALASAIGMYEDTIRVDSQLHDKMWAMCWEAVQRAIRQGKEHHDYEVPANIYGPYPVYRREEMVLYLCGECRQQGFKVQMLSPTGGVIRISGWAERARTKLKQEQEFARDFRVTYTSDDVRDEGEIMRVPRATKPGQPPLGTLSARLKHVAARGRDRKIN